MRGLMMTRHCWMNEKWSARCQSIIHEFHEFLSIGPTFCQLQSREMCCNMPFFPYVWEKSRPMSVFCRSMGYLLPKWKDNVVVPGWGLIGFSLHGQYDMNFNMWCKSYWTWWHIGVRLILMESKSKLGLWIESQLSSFGLASIPAISGCAGITDRLRRPDRVSLVKGIPLRLLRSVLAD